MAASANGTGRTHGWRNRITGYADVDPADLLANPKNYRRHPKEQEAALSGVIDQVGYLDPVLVQAGTNVVINGHLRLELAKREGQSSIPVAYVDLSDAEADLVLATFDPLTAMATHDQEALSELLALVETEDAAVLALLATLSGEAPIAEGLTDPDAVPSVPADPTTKPGDLWLLGRHRLLCGDSTYPEAIDRVMGSGKADVVFTDPPYGVNVTGKGGDAIAGDISFTAIPLMFGVLARILAPGAWLYICGGQSNMPLYSRLFEHHFRQLPRVIIWDKGKTAVLRQNGYHSCYEMIYWTFLEGGGGRWFSERTSEHADDIWRISVDADNDRDHPTQKPVALPERAIRNSCPPGGVVFDPFGGSGSTLLGCERSGHVCRVIEMSPHYCDVIVRRWEAFTGQTATRATAAD